MKFVNKVSVLSLVVLMFSFMNVANAMNVCAGNQVKTSCKEINKLKVTDDEKAIECNQAYEASSSNSATQCRWTEKLENFSGGKPNTKMTCNASGSTCTPPI